MSAPVTFLGVPLSLISLVTLTVQNSALTIVLHYSRISVPKDKMYSAASAVLLNELLKGAISLSIAFRNAVHAQGAGPGGDYAPLPGKDELEDGRKPLAAGDNVWDQTRMQLAAKKLFGEIFSNDCWKLSIPACLYVIQNNLQFVAASNLDVPTFQVTYNLKILTTALFSVILLRRRLSGKKWFALLFLAAGVGVVQLQSTAAAGGSKAAHGDNEMDKFKGLMAVGAACLTSGLAGVYFEMVLKGSKADLWCRNVQLSFFSLLPALFAVFAPGLSLTGGASARSTPPVEREAIFANFGGWAWSVVLIQVFGGLVTALVIRYSDNIMKGFATSLAIVLSFVAGVILFDFQVTTSFLVGTAMVVAATYLYNLPDAPARRAGTALPSSLPSAPNSLPSNRNFSIPSSMGGYPMSLVNQNSSSDSTYPPQSPAFAIHSSNANTAPATNPAYRRQNPQHLPPGAQTPDVSVPFSAFSPLEQALANSNSSGPISPPNSVPNSTSHSASSSYSISRSTTPVPQVSSRVQPIEESAEGGFSSMIDRPSPPGSPDPKRRGIGSNKFS
ncbi:uncharacterized protein JCM15063_001499 [Sporobolomyces koalae]|uniref:uncharacterized protein n=1 Tax=Sporobolomyces koalae TaxID=500713 RepID=UPI003175CE73